MFEILFQPKSSKIRCPTTCCQIRTPSTTWSKISWPTSPAWSSTQYRSVNSSSRCCWPTWSTTRPRAASTWTSPHLGFPSRVAVSWKKRCCDQLDFLRWATSCFCWNFKVYTIYNINLLTLDLCCSVLFTLSFWLNIDFYMNIKNEMLDM